MVVTKCATRLVAFGLTVLVVGCHAGEVRLRAPVRCESVVTLSLGAGRDAVRAGIGEPYRQGQGTIDRIEGQPFDEVWSYGELIPDRGFHFWDLFDIRFLDGTVVQAIAYRSFGDARDDPSGVGDRIALHLRRAVDGSEQKEFGPLFKEVFGCDPPVATPASK